MSVNKYLERLKRDQRPRITDVKIQKAPRGSLTELPKGASVSFVSDPPGRIQKIAAPDDGFDAGIDGGLFLPWGPYLEADDVRELRTELVGLIDTLAGIEHWPRNLRDEIMTRAVRGPLSDLLPNVHHFRERLAEAKADAHARELAARRAWRMEGFDDRRIK
ncbi:hypothetical protein [Paraburkholderia youngii]|uniref:hypothetical protein n=1 Tax=Paraburkholderia youngii TaxID=2782701 RepID=UPI003D1CC12F